MSLRFHQSPKNDPRRLWPFVLFLALAVVLGCGGGAGNVGSAGGSGGSPGGSTGGSSGGAFVSPSDSPGAFEAHVLTGSGRASGTTFVDIEWIRLDSLQSSFSPRRIGLDDYLAHKLPLTLSSLSPRSQSFAALSFNIGRLILPGGGEVPGPHAKTFPVRATLSAGRTTAVQMLLDDTMVYADGSDLVFDDAVFDAANLDPYGGTLPALYSDCVRVSLSALSSKPPLERGGQAAYLYVSGDLVCLGSGSSSNFEAHFQVDRLLDVEPMRQGAFNGATSGTYEVRQPDPLGGASDILRFGGSWTNLTNVVLNIGSFVMIAFPSADASQPDHLLMLVKNVSGAFTRCYFGTLHRGSGLFSAYPIHQIKEFVQDTVWGEVEDGPSGGNFTILGGSPPSGFPTSGNYIRYLR